MKRTLCWSLVLMLGAAAHAQDTPLVQGNFQLYKRHTNKFAPRPLQTRITETLRAEPFFESAPFLKLRASDQLVRGQVYGRPGGKGQGNAPFEWSNPSLFLKREGKLVSVQAPSSEGRILYPLPEHGPLFRWALTRANADALFQIYQPVPSLSVKQLANLDIALQTDFAEYLGDGLAPMLSQADEFSTGFQYQIGEGESTRFVYAGFAYDPNAREVFNYRLTFGADEWLEERSKLISAPPRPYIPSGPQQGRHHLRQEDFLPTEPSIRRRMLAQLANSREFEAIINRILRGGTTLS